MKPKEWSCYRGPEWSCYRGPEWLPMLYSGCAQEALVWLLLQGWGFHGGQECLRPDLGMGVGRETETSLGERRVVWRAVWLAKLQTLSI
jgi:hypothetical protein